MQNNAWTRICVRKEWKPIVGKNRKYASCKRILLRININQISSSCKRFHSPPQCWQGQQWREDAGRHWLQRQPRRWWQGWRIVEQSFCLWFVFYFVMKLCCVEFLSREKWVKKSAGAASELEIGKPFSPGYDQNRRPCDTLQQLLHSDDATSIYFRRRQDSKSDQNSPASHLRVEWVKHYWTHSNG